MEELRNKLIDSNPAAYPRTAAAEIDSKNILQSLLDSRFIKGEIRVLDKYPNSDGILEITDVNQLPIGKIDIQLKTLQPNNYATPSYQCERSFFAYCENSSLPVILIVVNRQEKKAYWKHIDIATLSEVSANISGESYRIAIPVENCIDGVHTEYISEWAKRAKDVINKVWNYDSLHEQKKAVEKQLQSLENKLQDPTKLPLQVLKHIHNFLDKYNYILDIEFASIKQVLYPDYWKIGIGILRFEHSKIQYILFPVEYKTEQTLIKQVTYDDKEDLLVEMMRGNILVLVTANDIDDLIKSPFQNAYKGLEESILNVAGKYNFPLEDDFIANEYLISFIDRYHACFDMDARLEFYSLQELKFKLYSVLPMLVATSLQFADWVEKFNHNIDSYYNWKPSPQFKKRIEKSIKRVQEGFLPKVEVTITSELYNIELIRNYINYLEDKGICNATRLYGHGQFNEAANQGGSSFKKTWNKKILWENTKLLFNQFYRLYELLLKTHFPHLQNELQIITESITIICLLITDEMKGGPYLEVYHLRPDKPINGNLYFFCDTDIDNPINRKSFLLDEKYDCTVDGKSYEIIRMHAQTLEFMFEISPLYALINQKLHEKLKAFFKEKKSTKCKKLL